MNTKLLIIGIIAIVAIFLIGSSLIKEPSPSIDSSVDDDPRIIDWRHVHGVGLDPTDNSIFYIATHGDFYQSISGTPPVKVDKVRADYMAFNAPPVPGVPLYASGHPSTGGNTGLIKSNDGGITWEHVSNVIEPPVDFHAMTISKQNPETIIGFDSGARGLFKTIDAGQTWETLEPPEYVSALAISPDASEVIFAGTGNGIFKSDDGGKTWIHLNAYQKLDVFALAFDNEGKLFASVKTFGIVQSDDFGDSWEDFESVDLTVTSIAADSQNDEIYVGGFSSGGFQEVYKIKYDSSSYELIGTNKGLR
jgi:photosystem II stability/assembly factor-like uncharacterized protein